MECFVYKQHIYLKPMSMAGDDYRQTEHNVLSHKNICCEAELTESVL